MTTDQVLIGLGLIFALAVGSQLLAAVLRIPALIVLLPVGFLAGALTDDVNPNKLLGAAFQPMVSLAVAVILYEAGLGLDLRRLVGHSRRVVYRLCSVGVVLTGLAGTAAAALLLDLSWRAAVLLGAILVVSGPTVVAPLLNLVRPNDEVRRILAWEGSLIDPIGALLGALVFHLVTAGQRPRAGSALGDIVASLGVGVLGGVVGSVALLLVLRLRLPETLYAAVQLAAVVAVAAGCDALREDTGLIAGIMMGLAVANVRGFDPAARRPFIETLVQLTLGLLFIGISATITPASLRHLVLPTLGLVAVLVLVARPLAVALSTLRTRLPTRDRAVIGWMAPRGIVAAATAATFSTEMVRIGIGGAEKILPVTFLVIVATVTLYGLSAEPVARALGAQRPLRARPLLIGGEPWAIDLGRTLNAAGMEVSMWASRDRQRERIREAGLDLVPGDLLDATGPAAQEAGGVSAALLLTAEDEFNALAEAVLGESASIDVYRLAPPPHSEGLTRDLDPAHQLFGTGLTGPELARRHGDGEALWIRPADEPLPAGAVPLLVVRAGGELAPVTAAGSPQHYPGDRLLGIGGFAAPAAVRTADAPANPHEPP